MEDDVVKLKMAEMLVGRMSLKYQDKKTGDIKDEGKTKPEVIMRQLCTKPGQACSCCIMFMSFSPSCLFPSNSAHASCTLMHVTAPQYL